MFDVIIVGAGPAGLSAALLLGRCRRNVLVCDSGQPRNQASRALHGFLTRDGTSPLELRRLGRDELVRYPNVRVRDVEVIDARCEPGGFELVLRDGERLQTRMLLLATGRRDLVPDVPGFKRFYGRGVYHCPYCDGWEHRDQPIVVYGSGRLGAEIAREMLTWSSHLTLCTATGAALAEEDRRRVGSVGIGIVDTPIATLEGDAKGMLKAVVFADGAVLPCQALFFCEECLPQRSALAERLGCDFDEQSSVVCKAHAATNVPGLYVAGNVRGGLHLAIMAAAEGAEAAIAVNEALLAQK
jgi:thioredoxin reductase